MLQRIQSIFLLLALVLLGLVFVLPFAVLVDAQSNEFNLTGMQFPAVMLQVAAFAIALATIFLYKNRVLQIRFCAFNCMLLLCYQFFVVWHVYSLSQLFSAVQLKVAIIIPILAAILTFVAMRRIAKDEALVKSLDRLR